MPSHPHALLVLALLAGTGCGGRALVPVGGTEGDPPAGHLGGPVEAPGGADDFGVGQCWGATRAVYFGELLEPTRVSAHRRPADYDIEGDFVSVTFANETGEPTRYTDSMGWSGIFVTFRLARRFRTEDFPLTLDLHALPTGWDVGASRYGGYCRGPEGPCMSNASPGLSSRSPSFEGALEVTAGPRQTVTLCLTARADDGSEELFVWVDGIELEADP